MKTVRERKRAVLDHGETKAETDAGDEIECA
jgi:hypothetical protein